MNASIPFRAIIEVITSIPLDPTSTVCAIALLVVGAMTWRHILVRDAAPPARAASRRPRARRRAAPAPAAPKHPVR